MKNEERITLKTIMELVSKYSQDIGRLENKINEEKDHNNDKYMINYYNEKIQEQQNKINILYKTMDIIIGIH